MKEHKILASMLKSRYAWDVLADHVAEADFSEQGHVIYEAVSNYYGIDSSTQTADTEILSDVISRQYAAEKHRRMFTELLSRLGELECSPINVVADFLDHRRDIAGKELAAALLGQDKDTLNDALEKYDSLKYQTDLVEDQEGDEVLQGVGVRELLEQAFDPSNLIPVLPRSLNDRLDGGLKRGHHMVVFARPEMGKTLAVINMMAGFVEGGYKCLYVGNEDPIRDIVMRVINRLSGMNKYQVQEDYDLAEQLARENGYDQLVLASLAPGNPRQISALMESHKPDVLVLDQLRNLNMGQDQFVQKLEEAATMARNFAKRYNCVVVSVTQAGDSAGGKAVLDLGDVDFSNTGIPAQADVMVGIGATDAHMKRGEVVISLPKNKVSGKHDWFTCVQQPQLSKLESMD